MNLKFLIQTIFFCQCPVVLQIPCRLHESDHLYMYIFQGLKFEIITSNFEENLKKESFSSPIEYVKETAKQKVLEVTNRLYGQVTLLFS